MKVFEITVEQVEPLDIGKKVYRVGAEDIVGAVNLLQYYMYADNEERMNMAENFQCELVFNR